MNPAAFRIELLLEDALDTERILLRLPTLAGRHQFRSHDQTANESPQPAEVVMNGTLAAS